MDFPWLIAFLLGVQFLCGTSLAHDSVLPLSEDFTGHGTRYRFQYYVRDERGEYKTQEEAGDDIRARGSYAVEEPDGNLRIVQYKTNLGGGFKAHIKVDHAGKAPANLEEINIPAEEMRRLIDKNRKKSTVQSGEELEADETSISYVLGPPKKMSEIVMEQAAAIREIISKEIEAEVKREAQEKLKTEKTGKNNATGIDVVDCDETKTEKIPHKNSSDSSMNVSKELAPPAAVVDVKDVGKDENSSENRKGKYNIKASVESLQNSQIINKNLRSAKSSGDVQEKKESSPVVRVALSPRKMDEVDINDSVKLGDLKPDANGKGIDVAAEMPTLANGPVRNFSFKNRIMFYKPAERKTKQQKTEANQSEVTVQGEGDSKRITEPNILQLTSFDSKNIKNNAESGGVGKEEILLYSPYESEYDSEKQSDRMSKYIAVPYEVLRPYLSAKDGDEKDRNK